MRLFLLTWDTIDILCLVYSYLYANEIIFEVHKLLFTYFKNIYASNHEILVDEFVNNRGLS